VVSHAPELHDFRVAPMALIPRLKIDLMGWRPCAVIAASLPALIASARGQPVYSTPEGSRIPVLAAAQLESGSTECQCAIAAGWDSLRKTAEAHGVSVSVIYDGEGLVNATGGGPTRVGYRGNPAPPRPPHRRPPPRPRA